MNTDIFFRIVPFQTNPLDKGYAEKYYNIFLRRYINAKLEPNFDLLVKRI